MAKKRQHWLHKEYNLEGYLHKHLHFADDREYLIFLLWALFVVVFFYSIT